MKRKKRLTPVYRNTLFSHKLIVHDSYSGFSSNQWIHCMWERIYWFFWFTTIWAILDHWAWPSSSQTDATTVSPHGTENSLSNISWHRIQSIFLSVGRSFVKICLVHSMSLFTGQGFEQPSRNSICSFLTICYKKRITLQKKKIVDPHPDHLRGKHLPTSGTLVKNGVKNCLGKTIYQLRTVHVMRKKFCRTLTKRDRGCRYHTLNIRTWVHLKFRKIIENDI